MGATKESAETRLKRVAVLLAAFCLFVAIIAFTTLWEPGSVTIKAQKVGGIALLLFLLLMWWGNRRGTIVS